MDVFGAVASAIDLATRIVGYIQAVKGAKDDRLKLFREVSALSDLLRVLRRRLDRTNADDSDDGHTRLLKANIKGPLEQCYEILHATAKELERIASRTNTGKSNSFLEKMKDVTWPFRQDEIKAMLGKIENLKTLISLALQSSLMECTEKTRDELGGVGRNVDGIKTAVSAIETAQEAYLTSIRENMSNQELQDLVKWLSLLDFSEKHNTIFGGHARDTGEWFLHHPKFLAWRRGNSGYETLWCPGNPGVGKSVMASVVIDQLGKSIAEDSNTALVFIYLDYKITYTMTQLAEAILKQLVRQRRTQTTLESLRKHMVGNRPTSHELLDMLRVEVETYARVLVVIDALDEADIQVWAPLLQHLQALPRVSVLATSRDIREIALELQEYQRLDILANEGDVRTYIEGRLESSAKFRRLLKGRADIHEEVVTVITRKADGMFLLAHLHMNSVETKLRVKDLRLALDELPTTLDTTYDEAMARISTKHRALAYQVLSWLIHAVQPMTIHDLQYALVVEDGVTALGIDDLYDEASLSSICVGLVVLHEDTADSEMADSRTSNKIIGLVHYTAQEYFLRNPNVSAQLADSPYFAITCLRYLAFDIFETDESFDKDAQEHLMEIPFARYAALYWGVHARAHCDGPTVRRLAMKLLHDSQRVAKVGYIPCGYTLNPSALHLCAHFGLKDCLGSLLDHGYDINSRDSNDDTALTYATRNGQADIVRLLLARNDLDVNPRGHFGNAPIIAAAWGGNSDIMELLLAHGGVDINSQNLHGSSPLLLAVREGHEAIVQLLLARNDLDVNRHNNSRNAPLIKAARGGHRGVVELLLAQDSVDVNFQGRGGYTALSFAILRGHEPIVQLLLARNDLNVNLRDDFGDTPIIKAAREGHGRIVQLLLARDDVDINLQGQDGYTLLLVAIMQRHESVIQLLLARADLDTTWRDDNGIMYLADSAYYDNEEVARWLLAKGDIDINSRNAEGWGALTWAAYMGSDAVLKLLLHQDGIEINQVDLHGKTPLDYGTQEHRECAIELLWAAGGRTGRELRIEPREGGRGRGGGGVENTTGIGKRARTGRARG